MSFYDAGDAAIFYEISGSGKPVIFMHGYALNSLMWEFQKPVVSESYSMITVDLRGFGRSSCGNSWSGNAMADDISGLIEDLDLHECAVVGFSLSGPIAFRLALKHPDRISKLIMVSSILPSAGKQKVSTQTRGQEKELEILTLYGVEKWAEKAGLLDGPLVANMFQRNPDIEPLWDRMIKWHNPDFLRCMMEARANTPSPVDWRSRLGEVTQQSLIIAGAQDSRFIDASRYLSRTIPAAELQIIKGAGHMVNLEKPADFNPVLLDFLAR